MWGTAEEEFNARQTIPVPTRNSPTMEFAEGIRERRSEANGRSSAKRMSPILCN